MNSNYIAIGALLVSAVALGVSIKALDDIHTTNELLGEFLRAKSKIDSDDDNPILDEYIKEEEEVIADDSDLDVVDLDKELAKEDDTEYTVGSTESTGGIEYLDNENGLTVDDTVSTIVEESSNG